MLLAGLGFLFMLMVLACVSEAESVTDVERSDSADVRIVHSRRPAWREREGWWVDPEPLVVVGSLGGSENEQLVEVSDAARLANGNLVVADRRTRTVRMYDGAGAFLRVLGGPGSGPGEFQSPARVMVTGGDSVLVWDEQNFRTTLFDGNGELSRVHTLDLARIAKAVDPPLYPGAVEPISGGEYLVRLVEKSGSKEVRAGSFRRRSGALKVAEDISSVDTVAFFPGEEEVTVDAPWGPYPVVPPLARRTFLAHSNGSMGSCVGVQELPQIDCIGARGERLRLRWEHQPPPVAGREIEEWRVETSRLFNLKVGREDLRRMLEQVPLPQVRPVHSTLLFDVAGNLWVEMGPISDSLDSPVDHLVFEPGGSLLGVVSLPPIQVMEVGEEYLLGVYEDELQVQYLHLYSLNKSEQIPSRDGRTP